MKTLFKTAGTTALLSLMLLMVSCEPTSKDGYLEMFNEFVTRVEQECTEYGDNKWSVQKERYDKFSNEWYEKFKGDFSSKEKFAIKKLQAKFLYHYNMYKVGGAINDAVDAVTKSDLEKEMDDVKDELKDLGKETGDFLEEVFEEAGKVTNEIME